MRSTWGAESSETVLHITQQARQYMYVHVLCLAI
jgi:hypothetical protein